MTGFIHNKGKTRSVNKRILISSILILIVMIGSFILRELFPNNPIITKLFGGVNIVLFWVVSFSIFYKVDVWIFGKENKSSEKRLLEGNSFFITRKILFAAIIVCVLFFISLRYLDGLVFVLFWIIFVVFLWISGFIAEQLYKKNSDNN